MKNKFILIAFFALISSFGYNHAYAQAKEAKDVVEVSSSFIGRWKDIQDPTHLLEIYKDGSLTIVCKRSEKQDGSSYNKYVVTSAKNNRIMVDFGYGATPVTLTDDGSKLYFGGREYSKN